MQKIKKIITLVVALLSLLGCSVGKMKQQKDAQFEVTSRNPYPTIMQEFRNKDDISYFIVELKPESLQFDCSLRNDSPYYWCGVDGELKKRDLKLPEKIGTVFQSVVEQKVKLAAKKLILRLKKANKAVYLVSPIAYFIDKKSGEFTNTIRGIYNEDECMNLFDDFSTCPQSAKKFDLYGNRYIE